MDNRKPTKKLNRITVTIFIIINVVLYGLQCYNSTVV